MSHIKKSILSSCLAMTATLLHAEASAEESFRSPHANQLIFRHLEGTGIGFNKGYTTAEAMILPSQSVQWIPYANLRGHVFNNGNGAGNFGIGFRYLTNSECQAIGTNVFYDLRKTNHAFFNQVGAGLEYLFPRWELRVNGYFPVGKKISSKKGIKFDHFEGNNFFIGFKREFAFTGADAEVAFHARAFDNVDLYLGAGPYYFKAHFKHGALGGKARLQAKITDYVTLQGIYSYDRVFHSRASGELAFNIPFGKRKCVPRTPCCSCMSQSMLQTALYTPPFRNEIMVIDRERKTELAIDPATGNPFFFVFVNNTSSSNGTFESPFPTLVQAQTASKPGDVIYVFAGDGTSNGMNAGITLKDKQRFLGSGVSHQFFSQLGTIEIPSFTTAYPMVGGPAITVPPETLSDSTIEISGFRILCPVLDFTSNVLVDRNIINNSPGAHVRIIPVNGRPGYVIVQNNDIVTSGVDSAIISAQGPLDIAVKQNNLQSASGNGLLVQFPASNVLNTLQVCANNIATSAMTDAIHLQGFSGANLVDIDIVANSISTNGTAGLHFESVGTGSLTATGNAFLRTNIFLESVSVSPQINFSKNAFIDIPGASSLAAIDISITDANLTGVISTNFIDGTDRGITLTPLGSSASNLIIENNYIQNVMVNAIAYTGINATSGVLVFASNFLNHNTLNGTAYAMPINLSSSAGMCMSVLGNRIINNAKDLRVNLETGNLCYQMAGNIATSTGYELVNIGGNFFLDPNFVDNTGNIFLNGIFNIQDLNSCCSSQ